MLFNRAKSTMPAPEDTLPGRPERPWALAERHRALDAPLVTDNVPEGYQVALFGLAHTEQGAVGVLLTTCDAVFFCVLRYRYRTLWASVLAHGFNNTIGLTAFFLFGPFTGLW